MLLLFLLWSQVSNCWWLCELSSHLSRLPRVGHIPSHRNWFYQDKTSPVISLVREDQSWSLIGGEKLCKDYQCHWHCSFMVPWITSFLPTHFLAAIHGKSYSQTSKLKSKSGPPWPWELGVSLNFCQKMRDFQPVRAAPWLGSVRQSQDDESNHRWFPDNSVHQILIIASWNFVFYGNCWKRGWLVSMRENWLMMGFSVSFNRVINN